MFTWKCIANHQKSVRKSISWQSEETPNPTTFRCESGQGGHEPEHKEAWRARFQAEAPSGL